MKKWLWIMVLPACDGSGGGLVGSLTPGSTTPWEEVEVVDETREGDLRAVGQVLNVLRQHADQAVLASAPFSRIEIIENSTLDEAVVERRLGRVRIPANLAEQGLKHVACLWMLEELQLTPTIARTAHSPDMSDSELAMALCELPLAPVARRLRQRTCRATTDNVAHDLLFPLPGLEDDNVYELRTVAVSPMLGQPVAADEGHLYTVVNDGEDPRLNVLDVQTGAPIRSRSLPTTVRAVSVAGDVTTLHTVDGAILRSVGDAPYDTIADNADPMLADETAIYWVEPGDPRVMHLSHDDSPDRAQSLPAPGELPLLALVSREGSVWAVDGAPSRRLQDSQWESASMPHASWPVTLQTHSDGWGAMVHDGELLRVGADGRVNLGPDWCPGPVWTDVVGGGQSLVVWRTGRFAVIPPPG